MHIYTCITIILTLRYSKACVEWKILDPPIIFGETARLSCLINATIGNRSTRTWLGGEFYTVLSLNGAPSDPKKYSEKLQWQNGKFQSILEIKKFDVNDVNCDYSCSVGLYHENRKKLLLTADNFELHPKDSGVTVFAVLHPRQLDVFIRINKVYPIPCCRVTFNHLKHTFRRRVCSGQLQVRCEVGTTDITLYGNSLKSCPATTTRTRKKNIHENHKVIGPMVAGIFLTAMLVFALYFVAKHKKLKHVICCLVRWRGEEVNQDLVTAIVKKLKSTPGQQDTIISNQQEDTWIQLKSHVKDTGAIV